MRWIVLLTDETCCVGFLLTGVSSSESLLLLAVATFFVVGVGTDLVAATVDLVLFLLSSEESESDDESFFFLFDAVTGVDTAGFLATGVTGATIHTNNNSYAGEIKIHYLLMELVF
jgi:hypothetical protein